MEWIVEDLFAIKNKDEEVTVRIKTNRVLCVGITRNERQQRKRPTGMDLRECLQQA